MKYLFSFFCCLLPMAMHAAEFSIKLNDVEKGTVREIVRTFEEENDALFMQNAGQLMPKVFTLMETSPFQIIGYILAEGELHEIVTKASKNPLKWNLFMQAFQFKMEQEAMKGAIKGQLGSFSDFLSLDLERVEDFVQLRAWGDLAAYAIQQGQAR